MKKKNLLLKQKWERKQEYENYKNTNWEQFDSGIGRAA